MFAAGKRRLVSGDGDCGCLHIIGTVELEGSQGHDYDQTHHQQPQQACESKRDPLQ
jgi:hypothetical protein